MPGGKERELRRRIGSINSTKKITRAMELIAATRVVKAMQRVSAARPYARLITSVITDLAAGGAEVAHPLLRRAQEVRNVGFIVITGDRGLAGAYNTSVLRVAERQLMGHQSEGKGYSLFCVGRKSASYFRFRHYRLTCALSGFSDNPSYDDARAVAEVVSKAFISGAIDQVELIYTEFVSIGTQKVVVRRFLPLVELNTMVDTDGNAARTHNFEFEPSPEETLSELLPRYTEARLYGALLDAAASEHANRQKAMKAATDNAIELIISLSREMNRVRQDSVTTEIMEIAGGAEALGRSATAANGGRSAVRARTGVDVERSNLGSDPSQLVRANHEGRT